jgi:hypothetical protein
MMAVMKAATTALQTAVKKVARTADQKADLSAG